MSQAAKARRAFNSATPSSSASAPSPSIPASQSGLTLPQVISVIDTRLQNLETFMKEEKAKVSRFEPSRTESREESNREAVPTTVFDEFNHRTTLLAEEVANLKDIVLKLQAYTMDVNKMLYEERIHVLSDLGEIPQSDNVSENADIAEEASEP
jgi:hypothetical protein